MVQRWDFMLNELFITDFFSPQEAGEQADSSFLTLGCVVIFSGVERPRVQIHTPPTRQKRCRWVQNGSPPRAPPVASVFLPLIKSRKVVSHSHVKCLVGPQTNRNWWIFVLPWSISTPIRCTQLRNLMGTTRFWKVMATKDPPGAVSVIQKSFSCVAKFYIIHEREGE